MLDRRRPRPGGTLEEMSMQDGARVTWLMPVKNGMPFLEATLESIRAQTYRNYELLVWDNGSTDGTRELLESWIPERLPGTVIASAPLMLSASRAELVRRARTELCACIDADDISLPQRLEKQVAAMTADPTLVAIGCSPRFIDEDDRTLPAWYYPLDDAEIRWRTIWQCSFNHSSVMFQRESVLRAGNYREDLATGEDTDLWQRLSRVGPMQNSPEQLTCYRRHRNSTTAVANFYDIEHARRNAAWLFPGLPAGKAVQLWQASHPVYPTDRAPSLADFVGLKRVAIRLARTLGLADRAFVRTEYFQLQRRLMAKNMLRSVARSALGRRPAPVGS